MLWQRVITALVLAPIVIGGILFLDTAWFAVMLAMIILPAAYEMARLARLSHPAALAGYVLGVAALSWLVWRYLIGWQLELLQWLMAGWWILMTVTLVSRRRELEPVDSTRPAILLLGLFVLVSAFASITMLHASGAAGPALVMFMFVLIWVADSGAYFAGRAFGTTKLSPFVSPGKTWAGVGGAVAGVIVAAVIFVAGGWAGSSLMLPFAAVCVLVTLVSIGGDLWESRLKREAGVKDSGSLLPGHGGVLDRIDSLLAAAPVFALGAQLLGATA